jgi:hypothetical protein
VHHLGADRRAQHRRVGRGAARRVADERRQRAAALHHALGDRFELRRGGARGAGGLDRVQHLGDHLAGLSHLGELDAVLDDDAHPRSMPEPLSARSYLNAQATAR